MDDMTELEKQILYAQKNQLDAELKPVAKTICAIMEKYGIRPFELKRNQFTVESEYGTPWISFSLDKSQERRVISAFVSKMQKTMQELEVFAQIDITPDNTEEELKGAIEQL